jgi:hypothetical protein
MRITESEAFNLLGHNAVQPDGYQAKKKAELLPTCFILVSSLV